MTTTTRPTALDLLREGGDWLGAARNWIKWNAHNGSDVKWSSEEVLVPHLTVRQVEEAAAAAVAADRAHRARSAPPPLGGDGLPAALDRLRSVAEGPTEYPLAAITREDAATLLSAIDRARSAQPTPGSVFLDAEPDADGFVWLHARAPGGLAADLRIGAGSIVERAFRAALATGARDARDATRDLRVKRLGPEESDAYDAEVWEGDVLVASVRVGDDAEQIAALLSRVPPKPYPCAASPATERTADREPCRCGAVMLDRFIGTYTKVEKHRTVDHRRDACIAEEPAAPSSHPLEATVRMIQHNARTPTREEWRILRGDAPVGDAATVKGASAAEWMAPSEKIEELGRKVDALAPAPSPSRETRDADEPCEHRYDVLCRDPEDHCLICGEPPASGGDRNGSKEGA